MIDRSGGWLRFSARCLRRCGSVILLGSLFWVTGVIASQIGRFESLDTSVQALALANYARDLGETIAPLSPAIANDVAHDIATTPSPTPGSSPGATPTPSGASPSPTLPVPTPTVPGPTPTLPIPTPTLPITTPTLPIPTPTPSIPLPGV